MASDCQISASIPILELFSDPPAYTLPEEIRSTIRDLIAREDIEWSRRHPECVRHEWDNPDSERKWGPECRRCFSPIAAIEIIGMLETAIALHRALFRINKYSAGFNDSLQEVSEQLGRLQDSLAKLLDIGWSRFFFDRADLAKMLPAMEQLRELLQKATLSQQTLQIIESTQRTDFDPLLITLLGEILGNGSLFCFIVYSDNKAILSPGMEILLLCLNECGCFTSAQTVETILAATLQTEESTSCRK